MPIPKRMGIKQSRLPSVATDSGPPDYSKDKGNDCNDQEDMYQSARTIYKESQYPPYDQNDSNDVQ